MNHKFQVWNNLGKIWSSKRCHASNAQMARAISSQGQEAQQNLPSLSPYNTNKKARANLGPSRIPVPGVSGPYISPPSHHPSHTASPLVSPPGTPLSLAGSRPKTSVTLGAWFNSSENPKKPPEMKSKIKDFESIGAQKRKRSKNISQPFEIPKGGTEEAAVQALRGRGIDETLDLLSEEQRFVLGLILKEKSVFFTGAAGTGKSFLLKAVKKALQCLDETNQVYVTGTTGFAACYPNQVYVTGTTGVAACNIGGITLHSFAGIGLGKGNTQDIVKEAYSSLAVQQRWQNCKTLIIDEISMLDARTFDLVNATAKYCRNDSRPFGGIQLILCGDFYQLPPVGLGRGGVRFCFHSESWRESIDEAVVLTKVFRQNNMEFVSLLNEFRLGQVSQHNLQILQQKVLDTAAKPLRNKDVKPTRLFPLNKDVDRINQGEMEKLKTKPRHYRAVDTAQSQTFLRLLQNLRAPVDLVLKKNAQVILLKNLDVAGGLVNGSTGIIRGFEGSEHWEKWGKLPIVEFRNPDGEPVGQRMIVPDKWSCFMGDIIVAEREQIPLQLSWALSIHKSQGLTIPNLEVSLGNNVFDYGQAYVALSRATNLETLRVKEFVPHVVRAHPEIHAFYSNLKSTDSLKQSQMMGEPNNTKENAAPNQSTGWMTKKRKPSSTIFGSIFNMLKPGL